MVVGFNHNFRYQGEVYHIQTEDSGVSSPNIITLLYHGGTILASKKTSYADIAKVDNLEQVVEELMKEQHKNMLRSLKAGEFDTVIERYKRNRGTAPQEPGEETVAPRPQADKTAGTLPDELGQGAGAAPRPEPRPEPETAKPAAPQPSSSPAVETSLDEVILSYLIGDDK